MANPTLPAACLLVLLTVALARTAAARALLPPDARDAVVADSSASGAAARRLQAASRGGDWPSEVLAMHNYLRAKHGAAPLRWSSSLASGAQSWANICRMQHSSGGWGENLAWNYADPTAATVAWYNEIPSYDWSRPGWTPSAGHFTQVVWRGSTHLGCGYASGCKVLVCRYWPAGNVIGSFSRNVVY